MIALVIPNMTTTKTSDTLIRDATDSLYAQVSVAQMLKENILLKNIFLTTVITESFGLD
jgi:hypothetical protein